MHNRTHYIILLLLFPFVSFSQSFFRGKIVNEKNNEPLAGASIYFNNTTIGATSDAQGGFSIAAEKIFNAELIISSVGFETLVYKLPANPDLSKPYIFKLIEKEGMMDNILILSKDTRKKYLERFINNFLGQTQEAASSKILNEDAIYFTKPESEPGSFSAHADTPLVIVNKQLGYKLYFQLQAFYFNQTTTFFYGFTRYEELGEKNKYVRNRRKAYYGSTLYFYRSLIHNTLSEESYQLFLVKDDTLHVRLQNDPSRFTIKKVQTAFPISAAQVTKRDSSNTLYNIVFKNQLMVQYNKDPASKKYLKDHVFLSDVLPRGFRSYIQMNNEGEVLLDKDGILQNPLSVMYSGYWIYEKAANLLPFNYYPGAE